MFIFIDVKGSTPKPETEKHDIPIPIMTIDIKLITIRLNILC